MVSISMACSLQAVPPGLATCRADSIAAAGRAERQSELGEPAEDPLEHDESARPVPGLARLAAELDQEPDHPERRQAGHVVLIAVRSRTGWTATARRRCAPGRWGRP